MRINKKAVTALSFTLGALLFVTTAFADVALGSGYDRMKDSMKRTAGQMEKGIKNYTMETMLTFKDNGKTSIQYSGTDRIDNENQIVEKSRIFQYANGKTTTHYSYQDSSINIWKGGEMEDKYFISEMSKNSSKPLQPGFSDPFKSKNAGEVEKIFDVVIGSLKNYVQVEERPEGGRQYSGSISEAQVPALVNAISSYGLKRELLRDMSTRENSMLPELESDLYIKKLTGKAMEDKSGIMESIYAEVTMEGKDKEGTQHELILEMVVTLSDIGGTVVSKPDLAGKKTEKVNRYAGFDSRYIGKYKNDIIIEKDGQFVKIGERNLEITQIDDKKIAGKYYETCKPGFETYYPEKYNFTFEFNPNEEMTLFTYTSPSGAKESGQLYPGGNGKLYLNLGLEVAADKNTTIIKAAPVRMKLFDGQFSKIFDE